MGILIRVLILALLVSSNIANADSPQRQILIFVSFSMNDSALQRYFKEAESVGGRLIMRGLINNSFQETQEKMQQLEINIDIDPNLFEEFNVRRVPTIIISDDHKAKKILGHLPLGDALAIMEKDL